MNGSGLAAAANAAAVTSSGLDVATNSLRAEAMEQILSLQEAHHSRHPAAAAAAAARQQQQQQQQLMRYNEMEKLQELEQLRRMELMMQQQEHQQQQHFLAQYAQQQQQAAAATTVGTSTLLPHTTASTDDTPVELGSSHDFVGSQHLRAQLQRRILEEEIMDARSALSNNNSTNHAEGEMGSNGVGGVRLGSSSSNDVHRLQNILLQQELQSHQLPTYLSFGDNTSTAGTTVANSKNGNDFSKMNGIPSSQEAATNVMETNTPGIFSSKSKSHDEIVISKFLTVVLSHVPEVTSHLMELIPDVMAGLNFSSGIGGEKEENDNGNSEKSTVDPQPSMSMTENANRFPTVVNITLSELRNIQHNACLMESEDLYTRVTNCIVAIEPYTLNSTQAAGVDGGMYQQAREVLIRSKNNNAQVGYGDMAKEKADEEELPRQHSIMTTLAKNSQGGGKKSTPKQRKKRLPKRKVPDEESMSIMEMYRMEKKMKRKLAKKEMKRKEEEKEAKAVLGTKKEEEEEKKEIEATGTTTTTVIRHNLLASPYKIVKETGEGGIKVEEHLNGVEENQPPISAVEEAASEKAEKVSLSDEEPIEQENAVLSKENTVLATIASGSDECKASFASLSSNCVASNDCKSIATKSGEEKKKDGGDVASIFPLSSPKKFVEKAEGIGRKEDKSIRLQDGTLLFQPSAPPAFASLSSSHVVTATDANTDKGDASNNDSCSSNTLPPGTTNGDGEDSNYGDKKNDACCGGGDCRKQSDSRECGGKDDRNVKEDNDDNRADVANVLLGLMGR